MKKEDNRITLPRGWKRARLEEVCLPAEKVKPQETPDKSFTYIDISSIDNSRWRIESPKVYVGKNAPSRARQKVWSGDILFSTVRTYLKNVAMVPPKYDGQVATTGFCVLHPADGLDCKYVFYFVLNDEFVSSLNPLQRGTSYPAVRDSDVLSQELRLPPLPEQHRIVAEIEKQFTRLDASEAALKRAQSNLKSYRASVLKAAFEGKLVPTEAELAQAEGRDYEHADQLLERVLAERHVRWEAQQKRRGKYKEPAPPNTSDLPELPEGWVWATIDQLANVASGQTPKGIVDVARPATTGFPWFRVGDMNALGNEVEMVVTSNVIPEPEVTRLGLHLRPPGTIIFPKRGGAIATNKKRLLSTFAAYDLNTMGIIPARELGDYLWQWFQTVELGSLGDGSNVPQINHDDIQPIDVPVPPLMEQRRIVAEVERRLSIIRQAESTVEASLKRIERLRQSILKQAFSGQLVAQDPNDEPASLLLERIHGKRAEAEAATPRKRQTRRRRSKTTSVKQLPLLEDEP